MNGNGGGCKEFLDFVFFLFLFLLVVFSLFIWQVWVHLLNFGGPAFFIMGLCSAVSYLLLWRYHLGDPILNLVADNKKHIVLYKYRKGGIFL